MGGEEKGQGRRGREGGGGFSLRVFRCLDCLCSSLRVLILSSSLISFLLLCFAPVLLLFSALLRSFPVALLCFALLEHVLEFPCLCVVLPLCVRWCVCAWVRLCVFLAWCLLSLGSLPRWRKL